jgi:hypothetical protein
LRGSGRRGHWFKSSHPDPGKEPVLIIRTGSLLLRTATAPTQTDLHDPHPGVTCRHHGPESETRQAHR